jgi:hypothetical protein
LNFIGDERACTVLNTGKQGNTLLVYTLKALVTLFRMLQTLAIFDVGKMKFLKE